VNEGNEGGEDYSMRVPKPVLIETRPSPLHESTALVLLVFVPRRFRPSRSELLNGPGKAACGAAGISITIGTVNVAVLIVVAMAWHGKPWHFKEMIEAFVDAIKLNIGVESGMPGLAVLVAWSMLALYGRWRSEPSWLD
jgi:hypothetical protein